MEDVALISPHVKDVGTLAAITDVRRLFAILLATKKCLLSEYVHNTW
jgi:hypothetical protein